MPDSYGKGQSLETLVFLTKLIDLCREHGVLLSHEDGHGVFIVAPRQGQTEETIQRVEQWLLQATEEDRP